MLAWLKSLFGCKVKPTESIDEWKARTGWKSNHTPPPKLPRNQVLTRTPPASNARLKKADSDDDSLLLFTAYSLGSPSRDTAESACKFEGGGGESGGGGASSSWSDSSSSCSSSSDSGSSCSGD